MDTQASPERDQQTIPDRGLRRWCETLGTNLISQTRRSAARSLQGVFVVVCRWESLRKGRTVFRDRACPRWRAVSRGGICIGIGTRLRRVTPPRATIRRFPAMMYSNPGVSGTSTNGVVSGTDCQPSPDERCHNDTAHDTGPINAAMAPACCRGKVSIRQSHQEPRLGDGERD